MFLIKKKIINTILVHNSKMSHNIEITIYDLQVTSEPQHIRENQNGETSDTEYNDRRKHDYKLNWKNKKSDDNNKEK